MDITIFFFFAKFYLSFFSFCLTTADGKQLPVFFYPMYSLFGNCWNSKEQFGVNLKVTWEKAMAPHSSTLAWKIPWMEEPGGLQSMGSRRAGHDWATSLSRIGEGNGNPLQCSCLENPRNGRAWWAAIYAVTQSRTRPKRLSSSSREVT